MIEFHGKAGDESGSDDNDPHYKEAETGDKRLLHGRMD